MRIFLTVLILSLYYVGTSHAQPFAYVANSMDNTVSVINTATDMTIGSPIAVGDVPTDLAVTLDGSRVYVIDSGVSVIDTSTNMVTARL